MENLQDSVKGVQQGNKPGCWKAKTGRQLKTGRLCALRAIENIMLRAQFLFATYTQIGRNRQTLVFEPLSTAESPLYLKIFIGEAAFNLQIRERLQSVARSRWSALTRTAQGPGRQA
jgi:hypothetical protein